MSNIDGSQSVITTKEHVERNKLIVLRKFHDNYRVLWPKAGEYRAESRQNAWKRIHRELVEDGCSDFANKDWKYLRMITWKNWKTRFLIKAERMKKANDVNYSEADRLMMSIIEAESGRKFGSMVKHKSIPSKKSALESILSAPPTAINSMPALTSALNLIANVSTTTNPIPLSVPTNAFALNQNYLCDKVSNGISTTQTWEDKISKQKHRKLLLENHLLELQIYEKKLQLGLMPNTVPFLNEDQNEEMGLINECVGIGSGLLERGETSDESHVQYNNSSCIVQETNLNPIKEEIDNDYGQLNGFL